MPNQISGPNTASKLIANSFLNNKYEFGFLVQNYHAGGKINIILIRDLIKQIKHFDPDIVHLSGLQSAGFHAAIAARICRKKVILAVRGSAGDAIGISKKLKFVFRKIIEPITLRLCDRIYTVCEAMEKRGFIQNNTKGRLIGTIHNSAPNINKSEIRILNLRKKLSLKEDDIIVVIVGRLVYDKGITYIRDAIKNLKNSKIKFLFIGVETKGNDFSNSLKEEISSGRVFFLGKQDNENVLSIVKEADIFLFATLHENLSNALLEASILELAIIATNVGGNPEVITDNYNGLLIPPRDSESIIEALILLEKNTEFRKNLAKNAKMNIENNFSQKKLLAELNINYKKMLNNEV